MVPSYLTLLSEDAPSARIACEKSLALPSGDRACLINGQALCSPLMPWNSITCLARGQVSHYPCDTRPSRRVLLSERRKACIHGAHSAATDEDDTALPCRARVPDHTRSSRPVPTFLSSHASTARALASPSASGTPPETSHSAGSSSHGFRAPSADATDITSAAAVHGPHVPRSPPLCVDPRSPDASRPACCPASENRRHAVRTPGGPMPPVGLSLRTIQCAKQYVVPVPDYGQDKTNTCWAASGRSVHEFYEKTRFPSEKDYVDTQGSATAQTNWMNDCQTDIDEIIGSLSKKTCSQGLITVAPFLNPDCPERSTKTTRSSPTSTLSTMWSSVASWARRPGTSCKSWNLGLEEKPGCLPTLPPAIQSARLAMVLAANTLCQSCITPTIIAPILRGSWEALRDQGYRYYVTHLILRTCQKGVGLFETRCE